jgi:hypothetical protein
MAIEKSGLWYWRKMRMARSRIIKPGFFENKKLASCSAHSRLLFVGLWQLADRDGRVRYTESGLKGRIFQYEDHLEIGPMLSELESGGFLVLYRSDSELYLEIVNFSKHQHIHKDEKSCNYPSPKEIQKTGEKPEKNRSQPGKKLAPSTSTSTSNSKKGSPQKAASEISKAEWKLVRDAASKVFYCDGGRVLGYFRKNRPKLFERPVLFSWYLLRMYYAQRADGKIENPWQYLLAMHQNGWVTPNLNEGGDDNCFKEHESISYYCNPILGKARETEIVKRGGDFAKPTDINPMAGK